MKSYSDEEIKILDEKYQEIVKKSENLSWKDFAQKINSMQSEDKTYFQLKMLDEASEIYCGDYLYYPKNLKSFDEEARKIICDTVELLPQVNTYWYWRSVYNFFKNDYKKLDKSLNNFFLNVNKNLYVDEIFFSRDFLIVYKNAYEGFYLKLAKHFKNCNCNEAAQLCNLFEKYYYTCKNDYEKENLLVNYIQKNPETILAKEILGFLYEDMKLWNNAISIFEQVKEKSIFFYFADIYFQLAWCYDKVKNYAEEEKNYRKCLELNPEAGSALNNLGYLLYKQRRLYEAEQIILKCLDEKLEIEYAPNNLVRIYLMSGQIEKAKKFISTTKFKISKDLIKRVNNYSPKKNSAFIDSDNDGIAENKKFASVETKIEQFTNEKILEDELVARLESGKEIFGLNLKIYRGDFYGRQYPFYDGKTTRRIDILCEDERGNFYIIELKKDSGYGDCYSQIKNYIDYFEKNRAQNGKKVFGILCLNSPTEKLLEDVRKDNRIRLFEYKISYSELI